jgi:hypothetical protein
MHASTNSSDVSVPWLLLLPACPPACPPPSSCYEVKCNSAWVQDNYGEKMDRTYTCYDTSQSMIVRVTDTCPCEYACSPSRL